MFRRSTVPLAWRNLTENKVRLAASVAGTAFAVTLMLMETGFRGALLDSMVAVIRHLDGELFLIPARSTRWPSRCRSPGSAWSWPGSSTASARGVSSTSKPASRAGGARSTGSPGASGWSRTRP